MTHLMRVLALEHGGNRLRTDHWHSPWLRALRACFPRSWKSIGARTGTGLRGLLADGQAMSDAEWVAKCELLSGKGVDQAGLAPLGRRILADLVEPFEERCRAS